MGDLLSVELAAEYEMLEDLAYLSDFRKQLREFLALHGLPTRVCDEDRQWFAFIEAYAGVIEDGSLTCDAKGLQMVSKVVFSKGEPLTLQGRVPFAINWTIHLQSGKRLEVELESNWERPGFIVHSLRLSD